MISILKNITLISRGVFKLSQLPEWRKIFDTSFETEIGEYLESQCDISYNEKNNYFYHSYNMLEEPKEIKESVILHEIMIWLIFKGLRIETITNAKNEYSFKIIYKFCTLETKMRSYLESLANIIKIGVDLLEMDKWDDI